jgi:DNA-binding LytR/AlgR family response regulator
MQATAILADDEDLVRDLLRSRLQTVWPELKIVAEATDGNEAVEAVAAHAPQIAFLDIRMPERTGLQVAKLISQRCHVVFLTAYDEYAVQAFEHGAVDYLLKPVTVERLTATVQRLKARLNQQPVDLRALMDQIEAGRKASTAASASTATAVQDTQQSTGALRWIQATVGRELRMIPIDDVAYFEADEKYVVVRTREAEAVIRTPLKELIEGLNPAVFWPVHRATIVNVNMIDAIEKDVLGRMSIRLKGIDKRLPVSRTYSSKFKGM